LRYGFVFLVGSEKSPPLRDCIELSRALTWPKLLATIIHKTQFKANALEAIDQDQGRFYSPSPQ